MQQLIIIIIKYDFADKSKLTSLPTPPPQSLASVELNEDLNAIQTNTRRATTDHETKDKLPILQQRWQKNKIIIIKMSSFQKRKP